MSAKRFATIAVAAGLPFGLLLGLVFFGTMGVKGLAVGLASGVLFGLVLAGFVAMQQRSLDARFGELHEGQPIVHRGLANHQRGMEARGGFLILTRSHLYFLPHKLNVQKSGLTLAVQEIRSAEASRTLGVIPNRLKVHWGDGAEERFVVWGNTEWAQAIEELLAEQRAL